MLFKQAYPPDQGELLIAQEVERLATPERSAYHSTFATGWETIRILVVYSPCGFEQATRAGGVYNPHPPACCRRGCRADVTLKE